MRAKILYGYHWQVVDVLHRITHENESQVHQPQHVGRIVHELVPLNLLSSGELASVGQIMGQADQVHRLEELGLRGGACIEMVQPGSSCIIRLAGQKLCIRADELLSVLVRRGALA